MTILNIRLLKNILSPCDTFQMFWDDTSRNSQAVCGMIVLGPVLTQLENAGMRNDDPVHSCLGMQPIIKNVC